MGRAYDPGMAKPPRNEADKLYVAAGKGGKLESLTIDTREAVALREGLRRGAYSPRQLDSCRKWQDVTGNLKPSTGPGSRPKTLEKLREVLRKSWEARLVELGYPADDYSPQANGCIALRPRYKDAGVETPGQRGLCSGNKKLKHPAACLAPDGAATRKRYAAICSEYEATGWHTATRSARPPAAYVSFTGDKARWWNTGTLASMVGRILRAMLRA
jgi:hypothetical protein